MSNITKLDLIETTAAGALLGIGLTATLVLSNSSDITNARTFQREENKQKIIRAYRRGADGVLVEDSASSGNYIRLDKYLQSISDRSDKKIEEEKIKKIVNWYYE